MFFLPLSSTMHLNLTLFFALLSAATLPAFSAQFLTPRDRSGPSEISLLDYVDILGAAYSPSAHAVYVTTSAAGPAGNEKPAFRTDAYSASSGERLWTVPFGASAPTVRAADGVIALFASDGQRILLDPDGAEIDRAFVKTAAEDVSLLPPVWLPDGRLSIVASREFSSENFEYKSPRIWPAGDVLTDETGNFTVVSCDAKGGPGSPRDMTTPVPAPVEGQPGRVVFGYYEGLPFGARSDDGAVAQLVDGRLDQGTRLLAMDSDRAVIMALLRIGEGWPTDVVVGDGGEVYISISGVERSNEFTVYRVASDLSEVQWKQTFRVDPSTGKVGFSWNGMALVDGSLVLVAGVRIESKGDEEALAPSLSISGGGADPTVPLKMIEDKVPRRPDDWQAEGPPYIFDLLLLVLDPTSGGISAEPRMVGTKGIDKMDVFDSRGGRGAVLAVKEGMVGIVGNFGITAN